MSQDVNTMKFCDDCKMNVYPSRPTFNTLAFGICAAIIAVPALIITFLLPFSSFLIFIYFMWGFMVFNPYLIVYGLTKKEHCPRCKSKCVDKNLEYQPFGPKEPEPFKQL